MIRFLTYLGLSAAAVALALAPGARTAADELPSAAKVQPKAEVEAAKNDAWKVTVAVDRPDATYSVNQAVTLTITSAEKGHLYVVNADDQGNIYFLYPNEFQKELTIEANKPVVIPAPDNPKKFQLRAEKAGKQVIKAVVTKEALASVDTKELMARALTKDDDETRFLRLIVEAIGGDPADVKPAPKGEKPPTQPQVVLQKQKIEEKKPEIFKKKQKEWATGQVTITIVDVKQKDTPKQKDEPKQKDKPKQDEKPNT